MSLCKMFNLSLIFICELWMIRLFVEGDCRQKMRVGELIHLKGVVHLNCSCFFLCFFLPLESMASLGFYRIRLFASPQQQRGYVD